MKHLVILYLLIGIATPVNAGVPSKAIREAAEMVLRKFGKEAAELGVDTIAQQTEKLVVKYGDEAIEAVRKAGPKTFRLVEETGEHGIHTVKILARYGDEATWIIAKKDRMALFFKYGDNAADAMIKQGAVGQRIISSIGSPAASALTSVSKQNGRRLSMMIDDGTLRRMGRTEELLWVVSKYGDQAMDFIWRNKGALATTAFLTSFLADPKPFLDGTTTLTTQTAAAVVAPAAKAAAERTNWTLLGTFSLIGAVSLFAWHHWLKHREITSSHLETVRPVTVVETNACKVNPNASLDSNRPSEHGFRFTSLQDRVRPTE